MAIVSFIQRTLPSDVSEAIKLSPNPLVYDELPPNGHHPPPLLLSPEVDEVPPIENVVSCPPASNRSLSPSPPMVIIPPLLLCDVVVVVDDDDDDGDLLLESPVGIMPSPPEMGGAVISLAGGPMAIAFGSARFNRK